jgi:endonuclease/exonuclease/phosphatase family metal-dependent hydrolase
VGADLDPLMSALASPNTDDDQPALQHAIAILQQTDYNARIRAVAREIEAIRPHVVGLQEVSKIDINLPGSDIAPIHQDFLALLLERLADRGLNYVAAAHTVNFVATPFPGISLTDYDVILVDASRASPKGKDEHLYSQNVGLVAPGVELKRGMVRLVVETSTSRYVIVSTHLESGNTPALADLRVHQVKELLSRLGTPVSPVILMGDFNDVPGSPVYNVLMNSGFTDTWEQIWPGPGYTCCSMPNLSNVNPIFNQRLDYIFTRGLVGTPDVQIFGDRSTARIPGPLHMIWPSDHAGLAIHIGGGEQTPQ